MDPIKYFGTRSLDELIVEIQNSLSKRAKELQFSTMPDASKYAGKVVQYVGTTDVSFTRSHFYYSNGTRWIEENVDKRDPDIANIQIVTSLPDWAAADASTLYCVKDTATGSMALFVKNVAVVDGFYTVETGGSFSVVSVLPEWSAAKTNTIYFKANGNTLTGYIKKTGTIGAWYTVGGSGAEIIVDTMLSNSSTNPVQNKVIYAAIQDVLAQVSSIYHYKGSCTTAALPTSNNVVGDVWNLTDASDYGPVGTNVAWDGSEWDALGGDLVIDPVPADGSEHAVASGGVYDALEEKEDVSNKVIALDDTVTDEQYPSAKCVKDALDGLEPIPPGFVQNVDTTMQPVEDGKVMRISKAAFDALSARNPDIMYYLDEEHDLIDAKPTCKDTAGNLVKGQKIVELTKAQYDALATKDSNTYYMINDDNVAKTWYPKPDWSNRVSRTAAQMAAGYTCPSDGMFVACLSFAATAATLTVNGVTIATSHHYSANDHEVPLYVQVPVCVGDVVKTSSTPNTFGYAAYFVPWKE